MTDQRIDIYLKSNASKVQSKSLASFFGYRAAPFTDPRILRDPWTNRWVVVSDTSPPESPTVQRLWIAVSTTQDPTGSWCFYSPNVNYTGDDFFDYPWLGVDQSSFIIDGNVFNRAQTTLKYGEVQAFPKTPMLNCQSVSWTIFSGFPTSLAPPIAYDQNPKTFLISAPTSGSSLPLYYGQNFGTPSSATLTFQGNVSVPNYVMPADASQCGTSDPIETFDSRFVNVST